jgi:GMP synthase-like glutamine amidotransferase
MKVLLIDNETTLLEKLKRLIPGDEVVRRFDSFDSREAREFDIVILSGSSLGPLVENEDKFSQEMYFIKNTTKPLIGICFGFELIVRAFGGQLKKLEKKDQGIKSINILDDSLYKKSTIKVYENHEWTVDKLPDVLDVSAESSAGPEIIKHKTLPIYGFQFHPENFVDELEGDEVFLQLFPQLQEI